MSQLIELKVPDIGDSKNVDVIEVFIKVGDSIKENDSLITLETDKATMEVPATFTGEIKELKVSLGDKVSEGTVIAILEVTSVEALEMPKAEAPIESKRPETENSKAIRMEIFVPDIGSNSNVDVIEVLVKVGETIDKEMPLVVLETDKATMEVPSTMHGVVESVHVKVGDKVSAGSLIVSLLSQSGDLQAKVESAPVLDKPALAPAPSPKSAEQELPKIPQSTLVNRPALFDEVAFKLAHASPSVRRYARELGADLGKVKGTGPKNRILKTDIDAYVKAALSVVQSGEMKPTQGNGLDLLPWPKIDFSKFGEISKKPLSRIKKISGANLSRNWAMIPHVTFNESADLTNLEAFRKEMSAELEKKGIKISPLAFIIKAVSATLQAFPEFNGSLDGDDLILKHYYHIGFAADTPNGLMVPVIKNVDQKGILEIAKELIDLSALARDGKLKSDQMQGATFTISSLGGIGGTGFTPIINAPEVAILGVCKSQMQPVWNGKEFTPRLMCPLSLSFDHRVIDGAAAARFTVHLAKLLGDVRRLIL